MIRRATKDDLPACAVIVTEWERSRAYLPDPPPVDTITGLLEAAFDRRDLWVVGDPVAGYMSVNPADGMVGALYLTHTGTGLGRRLMDIAKSGRDFLWLTVYQANNRALAFYRREGFAITGVVSGTRPGEPDMHRMEWHRDAT